MKKWKNALWATALIFLGMEAVNAQKTVLLDNYFNHEFRKKADGTMEPFHYLWADTAQSGFSKWGKVFQTKGFKISELPAAPTSLNLKSADVYIIVDPDTDRETASPNYISSTDVKNIAAWVKKGGVLVVLGNDSLNAEQVHVNDLLRVFGIQFNADSKNPVLKDDFDMGAVYSGANHSVFKKAKKLYLKEVSSLTLTKPAKAFLKHHQDNYVIGACSKFGKGTVIVVGDPWLYNEYVNGKLPVSFNNDIALVEFTDWIGSLANHKK